MLCSALFMCSQFDPSNMATPNMQEIDPEAAVKQVSIESSLARIAIPGYMYKWISVNNQKRNCQKKDTHLTFCMRQQIE